MRLPSWRFVMQEEASLSSLSHCQGFFLSAAVNSSEHCHLVLAKLSSSSGRDPFRKRERECDRSPNRTYDLKTTPRHRRLPTVPPRQTASTSHLRASAFICGPFRHNLRRLSTPPRPPSRRGLCFPCRPQGTPCRATCARCRQHDPPRSLPRLERRDRSFLGTAGGGVELARNAPG